MTRFCQLEVEIRPVQKFGIPNCETIKIGNPLGHWRHSMGLLRSFFEWPLVFPAPWMTAICPQGPHPTSTVEAVIKAAD